jgi:hypothetical protein
VEKPNSGALRAAGVAAEARARSRAGHSRPSPLDWYPEIAAFQDRGWKIGWIAEAIQRLPRQVQRILAEGRKKQLELNELPVEVDVPNDLLLRTPEAFEKFFVRFSGESYLPDHAKEWVQLALENPRQIVNTPPGHCKSTVLSIWFPAWLICTDRNDQILLMSKTKDLVATWGWSIASVLTSEEIVKVYGRFVSDKMGDTVWQPGQGRLLVLGRTKKTKPGDLSIYCRGMDQQILGIRANWIICDDIVDPETYESPDKLRKAQRKFVEIATRVNPDGHMLVVMQRVHPEDLTHELSERTFDTGKRAGQAAWKLHTQPMVLDWEKQTLLWPGYFSWDDVERIRNDIGTVMFSTMYQQDPLPPEATMIRPEWIDACKDPDRPLGVGIDKKKAQIPVALVLSIDPSPRNWNVMLVADTHWSKGNWALMMVDVWRWKGSTPEFEAAVLRACRRYHPDYLIVEESSFGSWINDSVLKEILPDYCTLIKHHTGSNKLKVDLGADTLSVDYEMARISIPWGDDDAKAAFKFLITEALGWPKAKIFDSFMATWFIKWNRKKLKAKQAWITPPQRRENLNASGRAKYDELVRQGALPNYRR